MSSIKQVQDLQSQLADLRQENSHLRSRMSDRDAMDIDRRQPDSQREIQMTVQKARPPTMNNFDLVRRNIRTHSRDIFEPPPPYRQTSVLMSSPSALPEIPSRADFARLSRSYLDSVHESFPVVHWPTFQREVDQVYTARSFQGMPQGWIGLFFAVMACGALQPSTSHESPKSSKASMSYSEISSQSLTPWPEEPSLTHAKVAILLSIFNHESNMKSAGSMWLASAVGIAQELGLHAETETWPVVEGETRRRLWWSIYTWDRILSLAVGRPMLINNEDCHVSLPSSLEDRYIQPQGFTRTPSTQTPFTGFAAIIHLVREFSHLHQALRSSIIGSQTLQSLDETFRAKLTTFPESYRLESNASLEPASLSPILILQFARFHLCRHNLSPVCRPPERADALHRCTLVAQETAKYISRTLPMPESEKNWQARVAQIASNMICTHIWRCMLVLCFRADYKGALMCLRLSAAIGDARKVNIACGKNLAFFLDLLLERVRSGDGGQHKLEHDEEMLAYVSGDMQGNLEHSWVWAGGDFASSQTPVHTSPRSGIQTHGNDEPMQGTHLPLRPNTGSPGNGTREWDGWSRIEGMIHQLIEEHRARLAQPSSYYPPPHNPVKRVQLAPDAPVSPPMAAPTSNVVPVGTNRISIANII
ncbi:hypothetical protein K469DRAFT_206266 [Zopfia rhizophila CBS 207.26]|uniref:Xylanolytic transcriptional activator regulatory domain-containing protein n=1 Tax=Zopfia rhizophila CBS 207.26 TaxID=1314779 RepID=A0A6A6DVI8_9PEZI|nr:hypothetical protein K469DRAFT_206266 [Zopfia rhizophila CBS 207.26]